MTSKNKLQLSPLERFIYDSLIDGIVQSNIKKTLFRKLYGYSWEIFQNQLDIGEKQKQKIDWKLKSMISYYAQKFLKIGIIEPISKNARPCIYRATCLTPSKREKNEPDWQEQCIINEKDIEVNRLVYRYKVVVEPKPSPKFKWDNINRGLRSKVISYYTRQPSEIGVLNIRYDVSPRGNKDIYITLPKQKIRAGFHDKQIQFLDSIAMKAGADVQRLLHCRLGLPTIASKKDYYVPVREPGVKKFLKEANIRLLNENGTHMDSSPPLGEPHFESGSFEEAKCYSEMPSRILNAESIISRINERLDDIEKTIERTAVTLENISHTQDVLVNQIGEMLNVKRQQDAVRDKDNDIMFK